MLFDHTPREGGVAWHTKHWSFRHLSPDHKSFIARTPCQTRKTKKYQLADEWFCRANQSLPDAQGKKHDLLRIDDDVD